MSNLDLHDFVSFENAEDVLVEALRLIMEEGYAGDFGNFVIVTADEQKNYYAQFVPQQGSSEMYGEVVGNSVLRRRYQLDIQQIDRLSELGWIEEIHQNFHQLWQDVDDRKRRQIARLTLLTLEEVYGAYGSAELEIRIALQKIATDSDAARLEQEYHKKKRERQRREMQERQQRELQQEEIGDGYIYVLLNTSYGKNILKIGKTKRLPEIRAQELSGVTGVPTKFVVAYESSVADCDLAERLIHQELESYRISASREFFEVPLKEAISIIDPIVRDINNRKTAT